MLSKIIQFVKEHSDDIILVIGVILISLLSFAAGFLANREQEKEPLQFYESSYNWRWDKRLVSGLEAF